MKKLYWFLGCPKLEIKFNWSWNGFIFPYKNYLKRFHNCNKCAKRFNDLFEPNNEVGGKGYAICGSCAEL